MNRKGKEEIEIDFSRAISKAQELEYIAGELSGIASLKLDGAFEILRNGWKGSNANDFISRGATLSSDLLNVADDLIMVAKSIRTTADIVYRAEKAANQLIY